MAGLGTKQSKKEYPKQYLMKMKMCQLNEWSCQAQLAAMTISGWKEAKESMIIYPTFLRILLLL